MAEVHQQSTRSLTQEPGLHDHLGPVCAMVLIRDSKEASHVKVSLPIAPYPRRGENYAAVIDTEDLTQLVKHRVEEDQDRIQGEVLVLAEDPRYEGTINDSAINVRYKLKHGVEWRVIGYFDRIPDVHRGSVGQTNPCYVLVTRLLAGRADRLFNPGNFEASFAT